MQRTTGEVQTVQASMHNYTLQNTIETEDTVEAYLHFKQDMPGLFYAANTYALNSAPEIEIAGSKKIARYAYQKLFIEGELVAEDTQIVNGKPYWGNGHDALFEDYYVNHHFFSPLDIKNTMRTLFGIYYSAYHDNKKVFIEE